MGQDHFFKFGAIPVIISWGLYIKYVDNLFIEEQTTY